MDTTRFQLVELIKDASIVAAGNRLYFQDQPQLRTDAGKTVNILAIEAYPAEVIPISQTGNTVSNEAAFKNAVLVLNVMGTDNMLFIPIPRLNIMHVDTDTVPFTNFQFTFKNLTRVDWTKSYIQFCAAPAASQFSYLFGVFYRLLPEDNIVDKALLQPVRAVN